ncbi:hypothetical protein MAC_03263 [Metarhizium acridum CQMa 102]|uniref:Aminoglycoside phosphotransferase domain-containing protein n=1 Tax=Metarhizium acridum (strain CQMa 102) TaxID=655827 RepID=E9E082_METAQ|nr:uncharacterized protein MAC_03263 [Metarhizium acridum CQMa 102]EFY90683.1 hypothetical protein MAC_03263 [Metarhizium acridum CQMa 102]
MHLFFFFPMISTSITSPTLKTQNHSCLSPCPSWDSAITIASSPSSLSSCDGIDDDECNFFSDSDELPSKSTDEKLDIGSGFSTPSTVQPVAAGQEEPERTPVPTPLDADRLHSLFSEYEKLVNGQEVPREREGSPDESTNLSMPKYLAQLTTDFWNALLLLLWTTARQEDHESDTSYGQPSVNERLNTIRPAMTTRNLLSGPVTLSAATAKSRNVLHALEYPQQKENFYKRMETYRPLLADLVAHHLGTKPTDVTISSQDYWRHGSFNLCIPVHIDPSAKSAPPQFVLLRFPLPYRVGEVVRPGNSDEKVNCEAATYAWLQENCPAVPIPQLYGFGLSTNQRFTNLDFLPWWSRWFQQARRYFLATFGFPQPSRYVCHPSSRFADLDIGYLLIQTITSGEMLSESWDEKRDDVRLQDNLQRSLARMMLSLASVPLARIGAFRLDNNGYLHLDNRPLNVMFTMHENEGIPLNISRHTTFSSVDDFILQHLAAFDNRLLYQQNAITSRDDALYQMTSLAAARAIFPQMFRRDFFYGPFVFTLTDIHRSNIFVDEDWNTVKDPVAFTEIFYDRILPSYFSYSPEELSKADYRFFARLWRPNICDIIDKKLQDRDTYLERLNAVFTDFT